MHVGFIGRHKAGQALPFPSGLEHEYVLHAFGLHVVHTAFGPQSTLAQVKLVSVRKYSLNVINSQNKLRLMSHYRHEWILTWLTFYVICFN